MSSVNPMSPFSFLMSSWTAFSPLFASYAEMYLETAFWSFARYIEKCAARTSDGSANRAGPESAVVAGAAAAVVAGAVFGAAGFLESDGNLPANTKPAIGSASTATAIARRLR